MGYIRDQLLVHCYLCLVLWRLTSKVSDGLPWKLLYADDLMLVVESMKELKAERVYAGKWVEDEYQQKKHGSLSEELWTW